jgi:hypothetical protein
MDEKKNRRSFLKGAAVVTLAGVASTLGFKKEAMALTLQVNANQKALMPDGSVKTRAQLMTQLSLNPSTPIDAWLGIGCGVNASGLNKGQLDKLKQRGFQFKGNELIKHGK